MHHGKCIVHAVEYILHHTEWIMCNKVCIRVDQKLKEYKQILFCISRRFVLFAQTTSVLQRKQILNEEMTVSQPMNLKKVQEVTF